MKVEGAAREDGRTPSITDTYAHSGRSLFLTTFMELYFMPGVGEFWLFEFIHL